MVDSSYLNYDAFARKEGRVVDLSGMSADLDQFQNVLNSMGKEAFEDTRKMVNFYRSDEYLDMVEEVYEDIESIYLEEDEYAILLDMFIPETTEEFYDPTDDMIHSLMYMDEMYQMKEDQLISGFDFDYGAVEDIKDEIDYKELHAGRTTIDSDGGFYASPTGGVSIEDYLLLQDVYSAYRKKLIESDEDVTELKRP